MRDYIIEKWCLPCVVWVGIVGELTIGLLEVPITACLRSLAWHLLFCLPRMLDNSSCMLA